MDFFLKSFDLLPLSPCSRSFLMPHLIETLLQPFDFEVLTYPSHEQSTHPTHEFLLLFQHPTANRLGAKPETQLLNWFSPPSSDVTLSPTKATPKDKLYFWCASVEGYIQF